MTKTQYKRNSCSNESKRVGGMLRMRGRALCAVLLVALALPPVSVAFFQGRGESSRGSALAASAFGESGNASAERTEQGDAHAEGSEADASDGLSASPDASEQRDVEQDAIPSDKGAEALAPGEASDTDPLLREDEYLGITAPFAPEANASEDNPPADGPPGFAWSYTDVTGTNDECEITGYTLNGVAGSDDKASIVEGTVSVPAVSPDGKKVVGISKKSDDFDAFAYLQCEVDFSGATNLRKIADAVFQAVKTTGIKGALDLSQCTNLTEIGLSAFNKAAISELLLPDGLKDIGNFAFYCCPNLGGSLTLPSSLETLGREAFARTDSSAGPSITELVMPAELRLAKIGPKAFIGNKIAGNLVFPASVTNVGSSAFEGNLITEVEFITTSDQLTLDERAFFGNKISVDPISNRRYKTIGAYCFASNKLAGHISFERVLDPHPSPGVVADNPAITEITISKHWKYIADEFFKGLTQLTGVHVPEKPEITRVGARAFQGCESLQEFDFNSAPLQDDPKNDRWAIGEGAFQGCTSLERVYVGNGTFGGVEHVSVSIRRDAFQGCTSLSYIEIPMESPDSTAKVKVTIGDRAFMDTNLGAFPNPLKPDELLGYLPLDRRNIVSIGESAFEGAGLEDVRLPDTLTKVGSRAFAKNKIRGLELPKNASLDADYSSGTAGVGQDVLAEQTVEKPAFYSTEGDHKGELLVLIEALSNNLGLDITRISSAALNVGGSTPGKPPKVSGDMPSDYWKSPPYKAHYDAVDVLTANTTFTYGYEVWRKGGTKKLSDGSVTLTRMEEGVPYTFHYYYNEDFTGKKDAFEQWVGVDGYPASDVGGRANYGLEVPGFHTVDGAYGSVAPNAGWRTGSGPGGTGEAKDPKTQKAIKGESYDFYNRWIGNGYTLAFDNNFDHMVLLDPELGIVDPNGQAPPTPDGSIVYGSMESIASCTYGKGVGISPNGFTMGGYEFEGWATSPDLLEASRVLGKNFFLPGSVVATPDPAPNDGGTVTLYAQWEKVNLGDDAHVASSIVIPKKVDLARERGYLWSRNPGAAPDGDPNACQVTITTPANLLPGQFWPENVEYNVYVLKNSSGNLLDLVSESGGDTQTMSVLDASKNVYDPGYDAAVSPGDPTVPLMVLRPIDMGAGKPSATSGSFYLKSENPARDFLENERYSGRMTFYFKQEAVHP